MLEYAVVAGALLGEKVNSRSNFDSFLGYASIFGAGLALAGLEFLNDVFLVSCQGTQPRAPTTLIEGGRRVRREALGSCGFLGAAGVVHFRTKFGRGPFRLPSFPRHTLATKLLGGRFQVFTLVGGSYNISKPGAIIRKTGKREGFLA